MITKNKLAIMATLLWGSASASYASFQDVIRAPGKALVETVDCQTVCNRDVCGIDNFKRFCSTLCSNPQLVKTCKEAAPYPFTFKEGKVVITPPPIPMVQGAQKALGLFCKIRCSAIACKQNRNLAALCVESCAPDTVTNCKKAASL